LTAPFITWEEAEEILAHTLSGKSVERKTIPVREALGRVVIEDAFSIIDLPPFDKSIMDGYAVCDERETYRLLDVIAAGDAEIPALEPGKCVKIMTGAPVPEGALRIVRVEETEETDGLVRVSGREKRTFIAPRGSDVAEGDPVVRAGERLDALACANLVSCGVEKVAVAAKPRVSVITTGSEIVESMADFGPGKIFDSNGPMLANLLEQSGCAPVQAKNVPDDLDRLASELGRALEQSDLVILSGGVSMGDFDFVPDAMEACGLDIHFSRVLIKPGRPVTFAGGKSGAALGLPGNPVSIVATFYLFALPALTALEGSFEKPRFLPLPLEDDYIRSRTARTVFVPARVNAKGRLERPEFHGSAHLLALRDADGFFRVESGIGRVAAGERVPFLPLIGRRGGAHGF